MNQAFWENKKILFMLSFVGAIFLWGYVVNSEPVVQSFDVPIEYVLPNTYAIANNVKRVASVKVSGPRMFMKNLDNSKSKLIMLVKSTRYDQTYTVKNEMFNFPFGLNIIDYSPKKLRVLLERKSTKDVYVKPLLVGELSKDVMLSNYDFTPKKVKISGPRRLIKKQKSILTEPIELSDLESKGEGEIVVDLSNEDKRINLEDESQSVFKFFIKSKKTNYTIKKVPIRFLSSRRSISSKIKNVSLDVLMPKEKSIKTSEVSVVADIPENTRGRVKVKLRATLPDEVHLLQINPEYINVSVK